MVYEDALTILSYASPYDVELEVESACKPTTTSLMKKSVGSSPVKMCHPLYRSQSIPELSKTHHNKSLAKKLFISDLNDSLGSNHSKSTSHQTVDKRPDDKVKSVNNHHHHKFGIKVLPALDATVHRIENQNEHNTNLERRNSKKNIVDAEKQTNSRPKSQQRDSADESDTKLELKSFSDVPSEVPAEVHNAAMAARKNRKNSSELEKRISLTSDSLDEGKSPQKNKRKAPAPPESKGDKVDYDKLNGQRDSISVNETGDVKKAKMEKTEMNRKHSESDTDDSEMVQTGFTKIELNPADITIHHTPVPEVDNDDDDDDNDADIYRKAASLGDLSKYENKTATTLERAQSLDMTDTSLKKRKAPMPPPEDISESTEDLTKLDEIDPFNIRKLKKSSEWGTLEDVIWTKMDSEKKEDPVRKKSNGFMELEDQKVEDEVQKKVFVKLDLNNGHGDEEELDLREAKVAQVSENQNSEGEDEAEEDTAKQKQMNKALKYFDMNFKSPVSNEIKVNLSSAWVEDSDNSYQAESMDQSIEQPLTKVIIKYGCPGCEQKLGRHNENCTRQIIEAALDSTPGKNKQNQSMFYNNYNHHTNVFDLVSVEKPDLPSPQSYFQKAPKSEPSATTIQVRDQSNEEKPSESMSSFQSTRTKFEQAAEASSPPLKSSFSCIPRRIPSTDSHFAKRIVHVNKSPDDEQNEGNEFRSGVTVNSKNVSANRHNVSNVSVSSGENSEDSGLVRESDSETRPAYVATTTPQKMTYITEIKVSPTNRDRAQTDEDHAPITSNGKPAPNKKPPVPPRRDAKSIKSDGSERQVVYVSEYKSPPKDKETTVRVGFADR